MLSQNDFEEQEDTDLEGHSQSVMVILLCAVCAQSFVMTQILYLFNYYCASTVEHRTMHCSRI